MKPFHSKTIQVLQKLNIKFFIGSDSLVGLSESDIYKYSSNIKIFILPTSPLKLIQLSIFLLMNKIIVKPKNIGDNWSLRLRFKPSITQKSKTWIKISFLKPSINNQYRVFIGGQFSFYDIEDIKLIEQHYNDTILTVPNNLRGFVKKYKNELLSGFYKHHSVKFDAASEKKALIFLYAINDILKSFPLRYWIEGGTLLGAIRNGKLIPWDHDLDMGIINDSDPQINNLVKAMKKKFYVSVKSFGKTEGTWNLGTSRVIKIYPKKYIFFKEDLCLDLFVYYSGTLPDSDEEVYKYVVWGKNAYHKKEFLEKTELMKFYGQEIPTPSNPEKFLEVKYGVDWKTPKEKWNVALDDGSIIR